MFDVRHIHALAVSLDLQGVLAKMPGKRKRAQALPKGPRALDCRIRALDVKARTMAPTSELWRGALPRALDFAP